jgi:dihydrofolate reductase
MSLDGYIAGPKGESDWIVMDPEIDFQTLVGAFDTVLMGRESYEAILGTGLQVLDSVWPIRFSKPNARTS